MPVASNYACKLPFEFDPDRLAEDVDSLETFARESQPGPYHKGEWTGLAIHASGGIQSAAPGFPSMEPYAFTPEADYAPYLKSILEGLDFSLEVVRALWLPPGGQIGRHYDFDINFQFGLCRLHIPMRTNADVSFLIAGKRVEMRVGEFWYGDFAQPHEVINRGPTARVHAVLDVEINQALLSLLPEAIVAEQAQEGSISIRRGAASAVEDLKACEGDFFVPRTVLPFLKLGRLAEMAAGAKAQVRADDEGLVLMLDGTPHCRLDPLAAGVFGIRGMPPGCRLLIDPRERGARFTLMIRGVQKDLVAARLGVASGERLAEQKIAFDPLP